MSGKKQSYKRLGLTLSGFFIFALAGISVTKYAQVANHGLHTYDIASNSTQPPNQVLNLPATIDDLERRVTDSNFSAQTCAETFAEFYSHLSKVKGNEVEIKQIEPQALNLSARSFELRTEIRKALQRLYSADGLKETVSAKKCADSTRDIFRALRFIEEFLGEMAAKPKPYDDAKGPEVPYLEGDAPWLRVNPDYSGFNISSGLKSGDLLMSRGNAITSALIARMGDVDAQFSHLATLYIDSEGHKWMIEAHIEIGTTVRSFEEYAADHNLRVVVFRQANAELAAKAAESVYLRAKAAQDKKQRIPYNFSMDLNNDNEWFCSQVAYAGYKNASQGSFLLPVHSSEFHPKNRNLFDRLKIKANQTFAPGDMEVDWRFDVVAEWKDISRVSQARIKDAVMTSVLKWGNDYNYELKASLGTKFMDTFAYTGRHWFGMFTEKFPLNMDPSILEVVRVLTQVGDILVDHMYKANQDFLQKNGRELILSEMLEELEQFRQQDLALYEKFGLYIKQVAATAHAGQASMIPRPKDPLFHQYFSPK